MDLHDSIDVAAPVDAVFAVVSDLPGMGRLSPENQGGEWQDGETGPSLGARFKGVNAHRDFKWSTTSTVVAFDPPRHFAFRVTYGPLQIALWEYFVLPVPGGCRVTECWTDLRSDVLKRDDKRNDYDRAKFTILSIRMTLERLKLYVEDAAVGPASLRRSKVDHDPLRARHLPTDLGRGPFSGVEFDA